MTEISEKQDETGCVYDMSHDFQIVYLDKTGDRYAWVCRFYGLRVGESEVIAHQRERRTKC